ncbi:hypothetical protein H072_1046 [Dactylellina haptotyla CBS 200.50]|uniref:Armadillo-like helical domain-containing protein n=1 Tax=Dactylellina haptotyla (strain CBS 200.50) TaxID=1284197 RepID=S8CBG3_DACHA|nr:hypothetical protein H072_1046 [Dactylellina haptotyla CBS 200.50]
MATEPPASLMASPLVQQERPSFQPKIVSLYERLFKDDDDDYAPRSEGFWTEFFLLQAHPPGLKAILEPLSGDDLLHLQPQTRQLFSKAVAVVKKRESPADEGALDTISIFLSQVLSKRYTNLSSDVIAILAGLDNIDSVFTDFVAVLDTNIRSGKTVDVRYKSVHVALVTACGAFNTGLLSYFTHRDLFPALMKFINDPATSSMSFEPFVLLGVLANYNKFEIQNSYQLRLADFVNDASMKQIVYTIGAAATRCREDYIDVQDDAPEGWSFGSVLSLMGLGGILAATGLSKSRPTSSNGQKIDPDVDIVKQSFAQLPGLRAAILLGTYDFVNANKLFAFTFISSRPTTESSEKIEPPFAAYVSLTSYITHHAHRTTRSTLYARLNLLVLRIIIEDNTICKRLSHDDLKSEVRLCRHRQPYLPTTRGERHLILAILDVALDGANHNLRKKLDVELYSLLLGILLRIISFLSKSRIRLPYHWTELWRSLLSLIRFFASYAADLKDLPGIFPLLDTLVNTIALSLSTGDSFLPSATEYDDLFYKLVETGDVLVKFRELYNLSERKDTNSIGTLVSVSEHYYKLIEENKKSGSVSRKWTTSGVSSSTFLGPEQVAEVIKNGYETLAIGGLKEGLGDWEKYREASEKPFLKKVGRVVVADARELVEEALL